MKHRRFIAVIMVTISVITLFSNLSITVIADLPDGLCEYSGSPYTVLNNNIPQFGALELTTETYESYSELDPLGRCGVAIASLSIDSMPAENEERQSISNIYPTGWIQREYDTVPGRYIYNRSHLIGWQLSAENDNKENLITGTRYFNTVGMLYFENIVADYIHETLNHVAYRVTPCFEGDNLVCYGVIIEGFSVEDNGEGISFNVFCYNVQPGIIIDYATGNSNTENKEYTPFYYSDFDVYITPTGKKYHYLPECGGKNSFAVSITEAGSRGLTPCLKCVNENNHPLCKANIHNDADGNGSCDICNKLVVDIIGDINGDRFINAKDLTRLKKYLALVDVTVSGGADCSGDGKIDAKDLTRLKKYLADSTVMFGKAA